MIGVVMVVLAFLLLYVVLLLGNKKPSESFLYSPVLLALFLTLLVELLSFLRVFSFYPLAISIFLMDVLLFAVVWRKLGNMSLRYAVKTSIESISVVKQWKLPIWSVLAVVGVTFCIAVVSPPIRGIR